MLAAKGQAQEAVRAYEAAANIRFDRDAALRLAGAWSRLGNGARAAQVTQLFLTQHPADQEALRLAAGFAIDAQDWRAAARLPKRRRRRAQRPRSFSEGGLGQFGPAGRALRDLGFA